LTSRIECSSTGTTLLVTYATSINQCTTSWASNTLSIQYNWFISRTSNAWSSFETKYSLLWTSLTFKCFNVPEIRKITRITTYSIIVWFINWTTTSFCVVIPNITNLATNALQAHWNRFISRTLNTSLGF
jgi:hypothetical protein